MSLKEVLKELNEKYGEGTVQKYGDMKPVDVKRISSGLPSLDYILGGGIPEGRILSIYGPNSSGKTTLAIKFLAEVQKAYPKNKVAFIDVEHALSPEYARALGLNMDEVYFCQPSGAEEALDTVSALAASGEFKAIILDSVAQLTPQKELSGDMQDSEMAMRARLMSKALRQITPHASKNGCTVIFINQIRTNIAQMYGNPETQPGGNALPFAASIVMRTSSKRSEDGKTGETTIDIKKNKVGIPFKKTTITIRYGEGFDRINDIVTAGLMTGVITKNGPMSVFADHKWKGEENMRKEIASSPELQKEIEDVIRNSLYA